MAVCVSGKDIGQEQVLQPAEVSEAFRTQVQGQGKLLSWPMWQAGSLLKSLNTLSRYVLGERNRLPN